jgi:hypothetical protein
MRQRTRMAMRAVRTSAVRLMDTVFGVAKAGACDSPWPEEGCGNWYGTPAYLCWYYNCVGHLRITPCTPPPGIVCY